jgi:hypothetical protein
MGLTRAVVLSIALLVAVHARAGSIIYTFDYTANAGGAVHSFSFSLDPVSSLITAPPDSTPAFSPFDVTDGVNTLLMTQDLVGFSTSPVVRGCFGFGSVNALLSAGGCGGGRQGTDPGGYFSVGFAGSLPVTLGQPITADYFGGNLYFTSTATPINRTTGSMTLTISAVPEPSSIALVCSGMALWGFMVWRRLHRDTRA